MSPVGNEGPNQARVSACACDFKVCFQSWEINRLISVKTIFLASFPRKLLTEKCSAPGSRPTGGSVLCGCTDLYSRFNRLGAGVDFFLVFG